MKEKRQYNQYTLIEKKKHAIKLNNLNKRRIKIGMVRYSKEFPEYGSQYLNNFFKGNQIDFELLGLLEIKIKEIEKLST